MKLNVLIVDDHPGIRQALKLWIEQSTHLRVMGDISSGAELLIALKRQHPDMVVLDLELEPGYTPSHGIAAVRQYAPACKIVIYSAHSDLQIVTNMLDLGVDGYILKVDDMPTAVRSLEEIAVGHRRFSPSLATTLAEGNWDSKSLNLCERAVLQLVADGKSIKWISIEMGIAERTAREYLTKSVRKLGAQSWEHAIAIALRKKIIS